VKIRKINKGETLREMTIKIGLKRQKEVMVEVLLNGGITELVISSEFARKQEFKLKEIKRLIIRAQRKNKD